MAVYIIQGTITKHVKVGFTDNIEKRMRDLQGACSEEIELVALYPHLGRADEKQFHHRFKDQRIHGEWFKPYGFVWQQLAVTRNQQARRYMASFHHASIEELKQCLSA